MERVREEKELFERGLARYTALRNVFTQQTNDLFDVIGFACAPQQRGAHASPDPGQPFHEGRARGDERLLRADHERLRPSGRGSRAKSTT